MRARDAARFSLDGQTTLTLARPHPIDAPALRGAKAYNESMAVRFELASITRLVICANLDGLSISIVKRKAAYRRLA
jgi:hypothetical protein